MNPILTIGITSYKRLKELERCIRGIQTKYADDIEIVVSEDKSPLSKEIGELVNGLAETSPYHLRFTTNEKNLGYDMNLGAIIQKAQGEYIFYMSDDDGMAGGFLDILIPFLKKGTDAGVLYAPFVYDNGEKDRVRGHEDFAIPAGEESAAKYIYDAILFSGLVFRKEFVEGFDASRFKNHNYFQVYMFLEMMLKHGGYYFATPSVICYDDGESAYGVAESSGGDASIANRKSHRKSQLAFNKTLIKVIRMFDEDEGTKVIDSFARQYSLRAYSGMSKARREGVESFKEYWQILNELDIKLYPITKAYYVVLRVLGVEKADRLLAGARKRLKGNG